MNNTTLGPQVGLLIWLLEDIRKITLEGVSRLTKEQLFTPPIEGEFCIGSFLMHLCECDLGWLERLSGKEVPEDIKRRAYYGVWYDSPEYHPPSEPPEVQEYLNVLAETRKMFLDEVYSLKDSELDEVVTTGKRERTKKWIISRIIQHEAHTRGQIMMLIRKAGWEKGDLWEQNI